MPDSKHIPKDQAIFGEKHGAVGVICLNRPSRMNAINDEIRAGLPELLASFDQDPEIHAILVHGGEGRGFCAGADITEARVPLSPVATRRMMVLRNWAEAFDRCATPIVAAIHGYCMGGGLEIALACDLRIASPEAQFALPETGLGLIPGAGGTQRLPRLIGLGPALDILLTGDRVSATEAHRIGLVTRLSESREALFADGMALAEKIASRAPVATLYAKEAAKVGSDMPLAAGMTLERSLFALLTGTRDKAEAARAFAEKRPPRFTGE